MAQPPGSSSTVVFTVTCRPMQSAGTPVNDPDTGITPRGCVLTPVTMWLAVVVPPIVGSKPRQPSVGR